MPQVLSNVPKVYPISSPFCQQLIQNGSIGGRGAVQQHDGTRIDPSQKLFKSFFFSKAALS